MNDKSYQSANRYSSSLPLEAPSPGEYWYITLGYPWVLCCVGNLNRVIPNYLMHMWIGTVNGGLAATLYGPSAVRAGVAGNVGSC